MSKQEHTPTPWAQAPAERADGACEGISDGELQTFGTTRRELEELARRRDAALRASHARLLEALKESVERADWLAMELSSRQETKEWTIDSSSSCMTVRIATAIVNRVIEQRVESAAAIAAAEAIK